MFIAASKLTAIGILIVALVCPQISRAETFASEEFLNWDRESQGFYFRTSIDMAGLIASQNKKSQAECIDRWFFENQKSAHDEIVNTMRQYPSFHPRGVILALIERKCEAMTY